MKTIFITERPTQIITALAICEQLISSSEILIIVSNCYSDATGIVHRLKEAEPQISFNLTENYEMAIEYAAKQLPAHLFIHWDVGFGTQKRLRRLRKINADEKISVFEEGIGTYRHDIYTPLKRKVFQILGLPTNIGGSKYIDEIYVYDKYKYITNAKKLPNEIVAITNSLESFIYSKQNKLNHVFSDQGFTNELEKSLGDDCYIYLSNWNFDFTDLYEFAQENGLKILKLHPFCKMEIETNNFLVAPKSLPAEILISMASRLFNTITVYHQGSSVPIYISAKNVKFKQINLSHDK